MAEVVGLGLSLLTTTANISFQLYRVVQQAAEVDQYSQQLEPRVKQVNQLVQEIQQEVGDGVPQALQVSLQGLQGALEFVRDQVYPIANLASERASVAKVVMRLIRSCEHRERVMEGRRRLQEALQHLGLALGQANLRQSKALHHDVQQSFSDLRLQIDQDVVSRLDEIRSMLRSSSDTNVVQPKLLTFLDCGPVEADDLATLEAEHTRMQKDAELAKEAALLELIIQALDADNVKRKDSKKAQDDILELCKCPITKEVMTDPVILAKSGVPGIAYERSAIEKWLKDNDTCPSTNVPLNGEHTLKEDFTVRRLLENCHKGSLLAPIASLDTVRVDDQVSTPAPDAAAQQPSAVDDADSRPVRQPSTVHAAPYTAPEPYKHEPVSRAATVNSGRNTFNTKVEEESYCGPLSCIICLLGIPCIMCCPVDKKQTVVVRHE